MHVRIRVLSATTKSEDLVIKVSKTTPIKELQIVIHKKLSVELNHQKLYYKGKQLVPDHTIFDYSIGLNDVIHLMISTKTDDYSSNKENEDTNDKKLSEEEEKTETCSRYYKNGDRIDVIDNDHGAWFEAKIINILTKENSDKVDEKKLIFKIRMDRNVETAPLEVTFDDIRPRAHFIFDKSELQPGMIVFVNYNIESPAMRGYWYDFEITEVRKKDVKGVLLVGRDRARIENCTVKFIDEIMRIEEVKLLTDRQTDLGEIPLRKLPLYCTKCKDNPTKKCRECGCYICAKKDSEGILILCDECDRAYHLKCLNPPLSEVPTDAEWYCPNCKTDDSKIVKAGEKLKESKKKKTGGTTRDWGKGMACVGRTSECTIVPKNHYGPIPGIDVGTCWKFRVQVSEAGVHRPPVAGIHGRATDGAYSLVLSGGYEDDIDNGEEFYYTGSGGRDLSGNKRTSAQSCDQKLTDMNKALALNCNVKFNEKTGGEAKDWKNGKPVRVVRNYKLGKHSKYAPVDGNRYDGIYKVVKYYPEKGKSGYIVWRYLLRRDDSSPAPWQKGGKELEMIYPPGHLEAEEMKEEKRKSTKRKPNNSLDNFLVSEKKRKVVPHELDQELKKLISEDETNKKLWDECIESLKEGKQKFLQKVEEIFMCVCCREVLYEPVTVTCNHNVCKGCLKNSFSTQIYSCPWCRFDLGEKYVIKVNFNLSEALKLLFPGYEAGR